MFQELKTSIRALREEDFQDIIRITREYLWKHYLVVPILPYAMYKIRKFDASNDVDKLVDFTYTFWHGLLRPLQVRNELVELVKDVDKEKPRYILEIGTALGGTLFLFCRMASENAVIISIDLPLGMGGGGYSQARKPLYESFTSQQQHMYLIRGDSHKREIVEKVKALLDGKEIDFLFIDGDHTYEGVKQDFEMYSPFVKKNGIIALHDIIESKYKGCEVSKFWNEIQDRYEHRTIVEDYAQKWAGIGLIKK
jgi:cephalosporin hydroxylase